jgi:hypothetical protein
VLKKSKTSKNNSQILKDLESFNGSVFHSDLETSFSINSIKKKKKKKKKKKNRRKKVNPQKSLNTCSKKVQANLFSSVNEDKLGQVLMNPMHQYSPWNNSNRNKLVGKGYRNFIIVRILGYYGWSSSFFGI